MLKKCFIFVIFCSFLDGFLIQNDSPRHVTKVISVTNGGLWGDWHPARYCAVGSYAVGFNMRVEPYTHGSDDTALNGLELLCETLTGQYAGYIESGEGQWGTWYGKSQCQSVPESRKFLTAFSLQVESDQGGGDDTAANWIKFKCREYDNDNATELNHHPGIGSFGRYGNWSESCPLNSAICGLQSRIESPLGAFGDDTAFNDVKFFCCAEDKNQ